MARFGRLGWFLGLVFGATLGVLFAPNKGKDLRDRIKADREKGKMGLTPLRDDITHLGKQIASLAHDLYESDSVQDVVVKGRKKVKQLHKDFVDEVSDFHYSKIRPMRKEIKAKVNFVKTEIKKGKKTAKSVKAKVKRTVGKAKSSAKRSIKIGKKAVKDTK